MAGLGFVFVYFFVLFCFNLGPVSHQESFLVEIFFLRVHIFSLLDQNLVDNVDD